MPLAILTRVRWAEIKRPASELRSDGGPTWRAAPNKEISYCSHDCRTGKGSRMRVWLSSRPPRDAGEHHHQ